MARQVASRLQHLGILDAARKRRLDYGPWAGGVYSTDHGKILKSVTLKKWDKIQNIFIIVKRRVDKVEGRSY